MVLSKQLLAHEVPAPKCRTGCQSCDLHCLFKADDLIKPIAHSSGSPNGAIRQQTVADAATVFRQNDALDYVVIIRSGLVKLEVVGSEGKACIFSLAGAGQVIGFSALISEPMRHNAVAVQATEVCKVPVALLRGLYTKRPELCLSLMGHWQSNLDDADQSIANFAVGNLTMRLAKLIVSLIAIGSAASPSKSVRLLSLSDMAAILGVSPESVCRGLAKLKRSKILKKQNQQDYAYDFERLKSLVTVACS
jgi:CRP-like cAMP-binding protein